MSRLDEHHISARYTAVCGLHDGRRPLPMGIELLHVVGDTPKHNINTNSNNKHTSHNHNDTNLRSHLG